RIFRRQGWPKMSKFHARARRPENASSWRLEPHVCRACLSRIASTEAEDGKREYRCTNCDLAAVAGKPSSLCACGLTMRKGGKYGTTGATTDLGVRCHLNQARSP